jgi:hypothetical protein
MTRRIVVFLGPTLERGEASRCLDAIYQPPVEQGDIVRAVTLLRADIVVLIDGVFAKAPAVRHKEILWALNRGISIYGAASMGALRAAEMHPFGMQGHGLIYRWYRATPLADDDEVAVAMMPKELGAHPLSEALIDMRLTLRLAERSGIIPSSARIAFESIARGMHFVDRTYTALFNKSRDLLPRGDLDCMPSLPQWVEKHAVRQKRADAIGLLRRLANECCSRSPVVPAPFYMTEAWAADLDASGLFSENIL